VGSDQSLRLCLPEIKLPANPETSARDLNAARDVNALSPFADADVAHIVPFAC
jgi:hypothetical protein